MDTKEQKLIEARDEAYREEAEADCKWDEAYRDMAEAYRKRVEATYKCAEANRELNEVCRHGSSDKQTMNGSHCKHGLVKTDCETCTRENIIRRYNSSAGLDKIRTAWCHYNALSAELEWHSLSDEGGDATDVTHDQVNHAWEDLNSLITGSCGNIA